jgi:hypothetical protein
MALHTANNKVKTNLKLHFSLTNSFGMRYFQKLLIRHTHTHANTYTHVNAHTYTHLQAHTRTRTHIPTRARTHTHKHTHAHIRARTHALERFQLLV